MCLGVPMEVEEVREYEATCVARGVRRVVSLLLLPHEPVKPGDHVLVHVGHAIQKLTPEEAEQTWTLLEEILQIEDDEISGLPVSNARAAPPSTVPPSPLGSGDA